MGKKSTGTLEHAFAVADRLHSASIRLLRTVRVKDVATGIGPAQLSALSVLVFGGPMSLKRLAVAEQVRPPTMSRIVAGLERQRLARREVLHDDRREIRLHATTHGNKLLQQARKRRVALLAERVSRLTAAEIKQLEAAAEIMLRMVHQ